MNTDPRLLCADCKKPIVWNDDAGVCIDCGGMNRRREDEVITTITGTRLDPRAAWPFPPSKDRT